MENNILSIKVTIFYPESGDMAHAKKRSISIFTAITFEILVQNQQKLHFWIALVMSFRDI